MAGAKAKGGLVAGAWRLGAGTLSAGAALVSILSYTNSTKQADEASAAEPSAHASVHSLRLIPVADTAHAIGDSVQLAATATDDRGAAVTGVAPIWTSTDPTIATVDGAGAVVAQGPGTVAIVVSVGRLVARSKVTVHQSPAGVRLSDTLVRIPEGEQLRVVAEVVDARGYRIAGSAPLWKTADAAVAAVDSLGNASGVSPGRSTLTAVSGDLQAELPVEVMAVPASVTVIGGEDQRAPAGRTLPTAVSAQIVSRSGRPIPGVEVQFLDRGEFGAAEPAVDTSDARGMVQTVWTLGGLPGRQHLAIAVEGVSVSPVLTAEADPVAANTRVQLVNEELSGTVGDTVAEPVVVRVTDSTGAALADVPVAWTVSAGGTVLPLGSRTDSVGEARARWKLGPKAGRQRVRVQVGNARSVPLFSADATAEGGAAASVAIRSGDGQSGAVGAQLAQPVVVRALDPLGNPVAGARLDLTVGAGSVADSAPRTDSTGQARIRWTLGRTAGRQGLSVRLEGSKSAVEVTANARPLRPANIAFLAAPSAATAGRTLAKPLTVEVTDAYGNVLPNLTVAFKPSSGSVARGRVVTDARGRADTRWTAGRKPGEQSLVAEVSGSSVRTTLTLDVSPAGKVTRP